MKVFGSIAVLVLGLSLSFGQSGSQPATSSGGSASSSPTTATRADNGNNNQDNHDWGWVGLLGLAGLGGLAGRKRDNTARDRSVPDIRRAA